MMKSWLPRLEVTMGRVGSGNWMGRPDEYLIETSCVGGEKIMVDTELRVEFRVELCVELRIDL